MNNKKHKLEGDSLESPLKKRKILSSLPQISVEERIFSFFQNFSQVKVNSQLDYREIYVRFENERGNFFSDEIEKKVVPLFIEFMGGFKYENYFEYFKEETEELSVVGDCDETYFEILVSLSINNQKNDGKSRATSGHYKSSGNMC